MIKRTIASVTIIAMISCNTQGDVEQELKTIDSLQTELDKGLSASKTMDTTWVHPVADKANHNIKMIKKVYLPDSIDPAEAKMVLYYKGFRKFGKKFMTDRARFIEEFNKSKKQLNDLKTDIEKGALKKEEVNKYLNDEKMVTTDLLYQFKDFKLSTDEALSNFDSLNPMIEKIIEVYSAKYKEQKKKSGITIH